MPFLSRRTWMKSVGAAPLALQAQAQPRRPNLLFIISDDHSYADVGCNGNQAVRTPNLDRLASQGMRFEHCFVTSAQCSPNRSSIFTGCAPHTIGTTRLHTPMPEWEPTFLEPLKQAGYFTGAFRKVHQGNPFNKRFDFYAGNETKFEAFFDKLPGNRPFWLQIGFTDPHRPYTSGAFQPPHDPAQVQVPSFLPDDPAVRQDLAHYYDFIARMDAEAGEVLAILEKRGLADNTLVIFTGDNGMPFPRAKATCYDAGIRVPMIARWPGQIKPGTVKSELIAHVDLAPTWLEAAGLPVSNKMQGRSFLPLLKGAEYVPRTDVFSERNWHDNFDPMRSVRTDRYKLIFNAAPHFPYRPSADLENSPSWQAMYKLSKTGALPNHLLRMFDANRPMLELYDLEKDAGEFANVVTNPQYEQVLNDLTARLSAWMEATNDYLPPGVRQRGGQTQRIWPAML